MAHHDQNAGSSQYTGHVTVGGPPQERQAGDMRITKVAVGPMDNNCYLLRCLSTGEQVLIDAAHEEETLLGLIGSDHLSRIITTHRHPDHTQALADLVADTGAQTVAGHDDADHLPVAVDLRVTDGDVIPVGDCELEVITLVGHTPGSIALAYRDDITHMFTGDSLFPGGVGKTANADDFSSLIQDVQSKLFDRFGDDTWIYPGHGDDTTLGRERPQLPEWRERGW